VENIITKIAEEFIKEIIEILTVGESSFTEKEKALLAITKKCASAYLGAYAEEVDAEILETKSLRLSQGYQVERRGDARSLQTLVGEVSYRRTYYKKASGGYEYLADKALGIVKFERVSAVLSQSLVETACEMSYRKASEYITESTVSHQTVLNHIRKSSGYAAKPEGAIKIGELHVDADEAHVTLRGGKKSEVPLISVYEGIEHKGKRNECRKIFHISEYGKTADDLWEQALTEIESRYDLTNTKIYLHGDGANWIQTGMEWLPNAKFVLDKYHKNKAIWGMTYKLEKDEKMQLNKKIREALTQNDLQSFDEMTQSLCSRTPERSEKILEKAGYLKRFAGAISICSKDPQANNGGCTEPHVSHVLAARLSSRPMAWSKKTLAKFSPILAAGRAVLGSVKSEEVPEPEKKAVVAVNNSFRNRANGFPNPDAIGTVLLNNGKVSSLQKLLRSF
jgi:hypothetical protein